MILALSGCLQSYEADSLLTDAAGLPDVHARRLDCLDVRVALRDDGAVPPSWPVVDIELGNRCRDAVYVDLRHVRVIARWDDAPSKRLLAFDPRRELDAAVLDGEAHASEVIAYVAPDSLDTAPTTVCVDVARITRAPAVAPVCFERGGS